MNTKPTLNSLSFSGFSPRHSGSVSFSLIAFVVGIFAGLGAVVFRNLISFFHNLFLFGRFSLDYNANIYTPQSPWGVFVILSPVLGALAVAFLVKTFSPEARGHGVPEVMDAIHYKKGIIRPMVALIKALASAISIGSGGSVGREGPIIQIGSSFGSTLAQVMRLPAWKRLTLIACGAGGGIAATFNTPIGGVLFAVEIMMHEVSSRTLVPVIISTVTATYVGRLVFGTHPSFIISAFEKPDFSIGNPSMLLAYIGLGLLFGLMSTLFIRSIYWFEDIFEKRIGGSYYRQHVLGMLLVGILFYSLMSSFGHYYTEGVGYATVQNVLDGWHGPALLLLLLFGAKLLATSLTLGSGASGGIFSPSMFMGATLGGGYGFLLSGMFPAAGINPAAFAVVGMASMIGASTGAALTAIVMIFEMTLDYNVIIPMTLAVALAYEVRKMLCRESIYTLKLMRRGHPVPDILTANVYSSYQAIDLMDIHIAFVPDSISPTSLSNKAALQPDIEYFLLEDEGKVTGISTRGNKPVKNFCVIPGIITLLEIQERMVHFQVEIGIVSSDNSLVASHSRGVITMKKLNDTLLQSAERYDDIL